MNATQQQLHLRCLSEYTIVTCDTRCGQRLLKALEDAFQVSLNMVTQDCFLGERGIFVNCRPFQTYGDCRYAISLEEERVYLECGEHLIDDAANLMIRLLREDTLSQGSYYGYCWPEKVVHYGLRLQTEKRKNLCSGVTCLHREYVRNDGAPVRAFAVIAEPDSSARAAVWGCPQGESMVVPEQVSWMRSLGKDVVAAVNADFFHFFNDGDKTTYGTQIIDGVVYKEPSNTERYGENWFGVTNDGEYVMSDLKGYYDHYRGKLSQAVGGGVWLLKDQVFCPHSSPSVDPRTAVAITMDGGLAIVCVDGRSEKSVGATYGDLSQIFMDLPLELRSVLNLDGGHSTILVTKETDGRMTICNEPSSGVDALRPVADILTLVQNQS